MKYLSQIFSNVITFEKKSMKKNPKKLDVEEYAPYLGGDMDVDEVERLFHEKDMLVRRGLDSTSASLKLLQENATPQNIPIDVFMQLDESGDENEDLYLFDDDDDFFNDDLDIDVSLSSELFSKKHQDIESFYVKQVKIGSFFELWPEGRLLAALPYDPYLNPIIECPNCQTVLLDSEFHDQIQKTQYINLKHMTVDSVIPHIPKNLDGIILDPPCTPNLNLNVEDDYSEWGFHDLVTLFTSIRDKTEFCFILIWVDPENMNIIISAAECAEILFSDSCVVELFEGNLAPVNIPTQFGLQRHSRMIFIFRTSEGTRDMFVKQKNRDCTWGIVSHNGKSRGRLGMPDVPHLIVEDLLPTEKNDRVFIELWPTRLQPHPNWILIDEIDPLNQKDDTNDEFEKKIIHVPFKTPDNDHIISPSDSSQHNSDSYDNTDIE